MSSLFSLKMILRVVGLAGVSLGSMAAQAQSERDPSRGLGFGVNFTLGRLGPDMEPINRDLPHCDVDELRADDQKIFCEQGWLRGNSPRSVELDFPGLYSDETVTIISRSSSRAFEETISGDDYVVIPVSERSSYRVKFKFFDGETKEIDLNISFYPVAP